MLRGRCVLQRRDVPGQRLPLTPAATCHRGCRATAGSLGGASGLARGAFRRFAACRRAPRGTGHAERIGTADRQTDSRRLVHAFNGHRLGIVVVGYRAAAWRGLRGELQRARRRLALWWQRQRACGLRSGPAVRSVARLCGLHERRPVRRLCTLLCAGQLRRLSIEPRLPRRRTGVLPSRSHLPASLLGQGELPGPRAHLRRLERRMRRLQLVVRLSGCRPRLRSDHAAVRAVREQRRLLGRAAVLLAPRGPLRRLPLERPVLSFRARLLARRRLCTVCARRRLPAGRAQLRQRCMRSGVNARRGSKGGLA